MRINFTLQKNGFKRPDDKKPDFTASMKIDEVWVDIGGAWVKRGKKGSYLSVSIDPEPSREGAAKMAASKPVQPQKPVPEKVPLLPLDDSVGDYIDPDDLPF